MSALRVFIYLPNPRLWKAAIAARLSGLEIEVRGDKPRALRDWLWDFDARPLRDGEGDPDGPLARQSRTGFDGVLYKTDTFLKAHPFGTVPAAFSPDGETGIFESNSIMRTVARLGTARYPLYGDDAYQASRIDSFLDASLVFARDSQIYLLAMNADSVTLEIHARAAAAWDTWMSGIERALNGHDYLVGDGITLADICFVCELTLFSREKALHRKLAAQDLAPIVGEDNTYPSAMAHYRRLVTHEAFAPDVAPYLEKLKRDIAA